jgi:hypothetical protein
MTALWLEPAVRPTRHLRPAGPPDLRLLGARPSPRGDDLDGDHVVASPRPTLVDTGHRPAGPAVRRTSTAVRRRRTLLAAMGLLLIGLALPLSGTGGRSHATGSALAETGKPVVYTVRPGDTLWSIAERVHPSADPRPLVAELAARTGSDTVTPGETVLVP